MLGDVLLINDMHKDAARDIMEKLLVDKRKKEESEGDNYKYVIAISGESGAGKSELSHSLALQLKAQGIRVKILHTDNYYIVPPLLRNEWRRTHGLDTVGINEYDWNLINKNIQDFREDREAMMPCIDIIPEQVDKLITDFRKIQLLVIDGLYAINAEDVDMRVLIELTYHETKISQIARGKEPNNEYRTQVLEMEHRSVSSLRPLADLFVDQNYEVVEARQKQSSDV